MEEIKNYRESFDKLGEIYPRAASVKVEPVDINGVNCYWFTPESPAANRIIVYLHGGSFAYGSIRSHESMVTHFSKALKAKILFLEYALAPEHPFPNGVNDVLTVYKELVVKYPDYKIYFIGDSAGGGLLISAVSEMLNQHTALPQAVVLISPWINLACNNTSYGANKKKDPILSKVELKKFAEIYSGDRPIERSNPENSRLSTFPPLLILTGTNEVLIDDSKHFYSKVKKMQSNSILTIYENQNHVWLLSDIHTAASQKALNEICSFLEKN